MDDLSGKIQNILSDEESMKQISELAAMLGLGGNPDGSGSDAGAGTGFGSGGGSFGANESAQQSPGGMNQFSGAGTSQGVGNAIAQLLGSGNQSQSAPPDAGDIFGGLDIAKLAGLAASLKSSGSDDQNIRFILALRPLLSAKKQARADSAIKILRLLNLLPLIKASGII